MVKIEFEANFDDSPICDECNKEITQNLVSIDNWTRLHKECAIIILSRFQKTLNGID